MKMKKIAAAMMVGAMVMTAVPVVSAVTMNTAYAAKGGARISGGTKAPAAAPKASTPSSNSNSKAVSGNGEGYKPSKDAKSLDKNAPAANSKSSTASNAANTQSSSRWGSALRNIGLFAGGMFLGSMLSGMLGGMFGGLGGGMMADILGLIMNVLMLGVAFMAIRWIWNKFKNRDKGQNVYRSQAQDRAPIDVTPQQTSQRMELRDIKAPTDGYEAKSEADKYRNR